MQSSVVIVSPALAEANNGNWQTASRWATFLSSRHRVRIVTAWPDADATQDELMIALHARRSAAAIAAWASSRPGGRLAVVLTGTDLYRDIRDDMAAQRSLELASRLVVLQERGTDALPPRLRARSRVIFQSTESREPLAKPRNELTAVMVGHMRDVKSPQTLFEAARLLGDRTEIRIRHIGRAEEAVWVDRARAAEEASPGYRWLGPFPHEETLGEIQRAHVLVHTSALEGGAHVIMEAVCSGTPVIASRVDGNVGMLGSAYEGYFPHGDAAALAQMLRACRDGMAGQAPAQALLERLRAQCALRASLFAPARERQAVLQLVSDLEVPA
jgi:putative glycosyltransferase (TIGR04348 family)